ncbi:hypothetical protein ACFL6Y_08195 [Elusimicrobiota bacterium]
MKHRTLIAGAAMIALCASILVPNSIYAAVCGCQDTEYTHNNVFTDFWLNNEYKDVLKLLIGREITPVETHYVDRTMGVQVQLASCREDKRSPSHKPKKLIGFGRGSDESCRIMPPSEVKQMVDKKFTGGLQSLKKLIFHPLLDPTVRKAYKEAYIAADILGENSTCEKLYLAPKGLKYVLNTTRCLYSFNHAYPNINGEVKNQGTGRYEARQSLQNILDGILAEQLPNICYQR